MLAGHIAAILNCTLFVYRLPDQRRVATSDNSLVHYTKDDQVGKFKLTVILF